MDALESRRLQPPVVMVLEGKAREGVREGEESDLRVVHAPHTGDDAIVALVAEAVAKGEPVTVVTADRGLRERTQRLRGSVVGPRWLLELLEAPER
jgi:rRNA-processing protein FCF1